MADEFVGDRADRGRISPLQRAQREIKAIKEAEKYQILIEADPRNVGLDESWFAIRTANLGRWKDWSETQKLAVLAEEVNWEGVGSVERLWLLQQQVDFGQVRNADRELILGEQKPRQQEKEPER